MCRLQLLAFTCVRESPSSGIDNSDPARRVEQCSPCGGGLAVPLTILVSGRKLTLRGDLDRDVCDQLQSSLTALSDGHVVVDMANVDYVDEAGLGVLVSEARRRSGRGGTVTVTNPSSSLRRQLETRGLLDFLRVGQTSPTDPENEDDDRSVDRSERTSSPTPCAPWRRWWHRRS